MPLPLRGNLSDRATHDGKRRSGLPTLMDRPLSHVAGSEFSTS